MTVINIDANSGVALPANTVPGLMHVYCVRQHADFGISVVNQPPPYTWHHLVAGDTRTFQVDNFAVWVWNNGPSRIQLLFGLLQLDGVPASDVDGATVLEHA